MRFLITIVVNGLAIFAAGALLDGVRLAEDGSLTTRAITVLLVGAIFGVVNALIKPVVKLFAFPFYILSLGLFAIVVNALMLEISAWIADRFDLAFAVDAFFWDAILAAVIVSLVSTVLNLVLSDD